MKEQYIFILLFCFLKSNIFASLDVGNIGNIPLEKAIRYALGKPKDGLSERDLFSLTRLSARGFDITHLHGIQYLKNIQALDLSDNQLVDISPLMALPNIQLLDLENNKIINIKPLSSLSHLKYLVLNLNKISDISPLLEIDSLKSVEFLYNPIDRYEIERYVPLLVKKGVKVYSDPLPDDELPSERSRLWEYLGPKEENRDNMGVKAG